MSRHARFYHPSVSRHADAIFDRSSRPRRRRDGGLTLPFAIGFSFRTETLRVSFRLTAGPGLSGAVSSFPRGNVPFHVYE